VDPSLEALDARELYKAGERRLDMDERAFIRVFSERSWAYLVVVAHAYHHMYDRSLEQASRSRSSVAPTSTTLSAPSTTSALSSPTPTPMLALATRNNAHF
jgi:hypothetical protein